MATPEEIAESATAALAEALTGPKRVRGDAGEVEQHSLPDLIAARKHLASQAAAGKSTRGLRITRLIPGGTA